MNAYDRIADVIRFLDQSHPEQPDLATLARRAGLSPFHFHRLFSTWAAITPKNFMRCLTVNHTKKLLQRGTSVLDASLAGGLSSPGRLHDLLVTLDAASPGEVKAGGEGWILTAGFAESPFGRCLIGESPRGICHLAFLEGDDPREWAALQRAWPRAQMKRDDGFAARLTKRIFKRPNGVTQRMPFRAFVKGTAFQVRVWRALLQIKQGTLTSYGRLATAIKQPGASRAVGAAIGQNALAYLIPCHRVIRETGALGDYRWGSGRKRMMLAWESGSRG